MQLIKITDYIKCKKIYKYNNKNFLVKNIVTHSDNVRNSTLLAIIDKAKFKDEYIKQSIKKGAVGILTSNYIKKSFSYCLKDEIGYPSILELKKVKKNNKFMDRNTLINIKAIPVKHGRIDCISYIINKKCAYASDVNLIYNKDLFNFKYLNFFVVDCLRFDKHPSHYNLDDVLKLIKIIKPKKTILTNLHCDLDYDYLLKNLPKNIVPAFDGMSFNI